MADAMPEQDGITEDTRRPLVDVKDQRDSAEKEIKAKKTALDQAKHRSHVTAVSAMSVVNVAMLKSLIERGPEDNRFYLVNLVLISTTLGLQVLAGLMAILIQMALGYLSKYKVNACADFRENCCPCRCVRYNENKDYDEEDGEDHQSRRCSQDYDSWDISTWCADEGLDIVDKDRPLCGCPCVITTEVYTPSEARTLTKYNHFRDIRLKKKLKTVKALEEIENQKALIERNNEEILRLKNDKTPDVHRDRIKELEGEINQARMTKHVNEQTLEQAKIFRKQGNVFTKDVELIRKNRVLKLATFWQHIVGIIFYVIFILNAFITGFGLGPSSTDPSPDVTTASP